VRPDEMLVGQDLQRADGDPLRIGSHGVLHG
jgi:hypothetical protein